MDIKYHSKTFGCPLEDIVLHLQSIFSVLFNLSSCAENQHNKNECVTFFEHNGAVSLTYLCGLMYY